MAISKRATKEPEPSVRSTPSEDEIRKRAYEIYLERGSRPGSALEDWLKAKAELEQVRLLPIAG